MLSQLFLLSYQFTRLLEVVAPDMNYHSHHSTVGSKVRYRILCPTSKRLSDMRCGWHDNNYRKYVHIFSKTHFPRACLTHSSASNFLSSVVRLRLSPVVPFTGEKANIMQSTYYSLLHILGKGENDFKLTKDIVDSTYLEEVGIWLDDR